MCLCDCHAQGKKKDSEKALAESLEMLQIVRDPNVDWGEKKQTVDTLIQRRSAAGLDLERLQKQGQARTVPPPP